MSLHTATEADLLAAANRADARAAAEPTHRSGEMAGYIQALAAELNATDPGDGHSRWMHAPQTSNGDTWHYLALVEHGTDITIGRMIVRRQSGNAGRVTITPLLGAEVLGSRGYYVSAEDKPALKPLTGEIVAIVPGPRTQPTQLRSMARRIAKRTDAWLSLIGKAAAWHGARVSDSQRRDAIAASLLRTYGGRADGIGQPEFSGVTIKPDAPQGQGYLHGPQVRTVELTGDASIARSVELINVPTGKFGELFRLLGY